MKILRNATARETKEKFEEALEFFTAGAPSSVKYHSFGSDYGSEFKSSFMTGLEERGIKKYNLKSGIYPKVLIQGRDLNSGVNEEWKRKRKQSRKHKWKRSRNWKRKRRPTRKRKPKTATDAEA